MIVNGSNAGMFSDKLREIANVLVEQTNKPGDIGLLTGKAGIALFFFYYFKLTGEEVYSQRGLDIIGDIFDTIDGEQVIHTYCSGLCGTGWAVEHLVRNDFIDADSDELLSGLDTLLSASMLRDARKNYFDFLHGAVGYGIYFLKRLSNPRVKDYLIQLVDELEKQAEGKIDEDGGGRWLSLIKLEPKTMGANLSVSHGMSGIMDFLGRLHREGIGGERVHNLLKSTVGYLLEQTLDTAVYMCHFPAWAAEKERSYHTRLGWCYGDLGTGAVLWLTARSTHDETWREKALAILLHSTQRLEPANTGVVDAGLCHGSTGIAHIYNRMYHYTGIETFRESALYWFDRTLEMASFDDGYAGYKALHGKQRGGWVREAGLLEGISGIGLALISAISDIEPKWDECLLLSG